MEKLWLLEVEDNDNAIRESLIFRSAVKALAAVCDDLHDRYHFDTEEPYLTEKELEDKSFEAKWSLSENGFWQDGKVEYSLVEKEVL